MSYKNSSAKSTGKITEAETDKFFIEHGFNCVQPQGQDIGIDRIVTSDKYQGIEAKIQVKGRYPENTPRWFQFKVNSAKIRKAIKSGKDLNELWKERIYMVDFWVLISIPKNEIWIFPSKVIHEIANINYHKYKGRKDNNFNEVFKDKNEKIEKKQKELNLDIENENGIKLYKQFEEYKFNISCVEDYFNFRKK
jgi:hypothetical protein